MTNGTRLDRLAENIAALSVKLDLFVASLQKLDEIVGGTAKTGGLKERLAIAEDNISRNKESFELIDEGIKTLRSEMLVEVGKIKSAVDGMEKAKVDFRTRLWQGAIQVGVATIVAGVVGVVFWQIIVWLAANAPVK